MSLVLSLERGRPKSLPGLVQLRTMFACAVCRGITPRFRWIPTELNRAVGVPRRGGASLVTRALEHQRFRPVRPFTGRGGLPKGDGGTQEPHFPDNVQEQVEADREVGVQQEPTVTEETFAQRQRVLPRAQGALAQKRGPNGRWPLRPIAKTGEATRSGESSRTICGRARAKDRRGARRRQTWHRAEATTLAAAGFSFLEERSAGEATMTTHRGALARFQA